MVENVVEKKTVDMKNLLQNYWKMVRHLRDNIDVRSYLSARDL